MTDKVMQMTKEELRELIETTIEQKLLEIFGDPDDDLEIRETLRQQLLRQKTVVEKGERGIQLENVVKQFDLS